MDTIKQMMDKPQPDKQATDKQMTDRPPTDRQPSERQMTDRHAMDRQPMDRPMTDKPTPDKQTSGKPGEMTMGNNKREGSITRKIERVTSSIPSGTWLVLSGGAIVGAVVLKALGRDASANFVGQWAPTILMLGLYNKMVKLMGSDRRPAGNGMTA